MAILQIEVAVEILNLSQLRKAFIAIRLFVRTFITYYLLPITYYLRAVN